jgi:hypothetical protein
VRSRITLHERIHTAAQSVKNAAVYIIRLPSPSPSAPLDSVMSRAAAALNAHIDVLRTSPESRLVLTALVLPAPGTVDLNSEVVARLGDLSLLQLANGRQVEGVEVVDMLKRVRDNSGGLILTDEIHSPNSPLVAFEVRYQAYDDPKL